jgi:hypothetical protein
MPIFVTVQPDGGTKAETMIYTNGLPLLAIHDSSASVMFTVDTDGDGPAQAARWAAELVRAVQQFARECQRVVADFPPVPPVPPVPPGGFDASSVGHGGGGR